MKNTKRGGAGLAIIVVIAALLMIPAYFKDDTATSTPKTSKETKNTESGFGSLFRIYEPSGNGGTGITTKTETKTSAAKDAGTTAKTSETTVKSPATAVSTTTANESIYKGKLKISSVSGGNSNPRYESISLYNSSNTENINITNFVIVTSLNETFRIPKGYGFPSSSASLEDIVLKPNETAYIYVGTQDRKMNFRENLCTGYFDESSDFYGVLNHACPKPDVSKMLSFSDNCIKALDAISACRMLPAGKILEYECNEYAVSHYSYSGCVSDFKSRSDFFGRRWLIWMQRGIEFFRDLHDKITLKDTAGKIVDEYQY